MAVRFVKFGAVHVNPERVLFVTDVYSLGELNMGGQTPIKTGLPTKQVIQMLEEAMGGQPEPSEPPHYSPEVVHRAVLADVLRYLEEKLGKKPAPAA